MDCLDDRAVLAFIAGELDPAMRELSEAHLDDCPLCLSLVAELARGSYLGTAESSDSQRYDIGEEIARGGMGTVHGAWDRRLGRRVAVKLMRAEAPATGLARRFAREVTLTARLQHPAIVPIYDAAILADGTPFYAMRLVDGQTLDRAVADMPALSDRLRVVPLVIAVADAIAYAHSEGVIHRDLKPQNILVGRFGEAVVLDWGLAKDVRRERPEPATMFSSAELAGATAGATTAAGTLVGSLAYMPPERLRGEASDERGDVYGLGAILYHVLAGGLPRQHASDEPEPLERRQPDAPRELVAIVARAMHVDASQRYARAEEVAEDLRRFVGGRLVAVHHYSRWQLAKRWATRHRAAIAVAIVAAIAVAGVTVVAFERVIAQREAAETERDRGEHERLAAEDLVSFMLGDLRHRLDAVGRLDALSGAAQSIADYFARVPVRAGQFGVRAEQRRSDAIALLGEVARSRGDLATARDNYDRVLALARDAAVRHPGDAADSALCRALLSRAELAVTLGDFPGADSLADECGRLADKRRATSADVHWQYAYADGLAHRGMTAFKRGDMTAARHLLMQASGVIDGVPTRPAEDSWTALEASVLGALVHVGLATSDLTFAHASSDKAVARLTAVLAAHPDDNDARNSLTAARTSLGDIELRMGHPDRAAAVLEIAHTDAAGLVSHDSSNVWWRRSLSVVLFQQANVELARGHGPAALELEKQARDITRELAVLQPTDAEIQHDLMVDQLEVANIEQDLGRLDDAARSVVSGLAAAEQAYGARPHDAHAVQELATALMNQADIEVHRKQPAAAAAPLLRAVELLRGLLATDHSTRERVLFATALAMMLDLPRRLRALDDCETLSQVRAALAPVASSAPTDADLATMIGEFERARKARPSCGIAAASP